MAQPRLRMPVLLSILAALVTLGLKGVAYWLTGSVGLLSDAVESVVNLVAATTAYASLIYSARPVDTSHTYGHEKIEFFSSGLEGVLILVGALTIAWYAVSRLVTQQQLEPDGLGLVLAVAASVINFVVARILLRVGRAHQSIVLEADGRHLMTDVWTSVGVVVGLALVWLTKIQALDPLIALAVAGYILWAGVDLIRRSFNGLMDHALPLSEQAAVRAAIEANLGPNMDYHALRTRQAGSRRFVDFHLLMPGAITVQRAHVLTGRIEDAVRAALPDVEVSVHVEPIEAPEAWQDSALVPLEQQAREEAERERGNS
jgi:cation diffusion facilitator family transporter